MIRLSMVMAVARAEIRLTRRLVRFWIFQVVALVIAVAAFLQYSFLHQQFSSWSGTIAMINPRFLLGIVGLYYLILFLLGLVFLGFDVRARDTRERMVEVLDTMPCTNLELLLGRFVGILIPAWIPVVLNCIILLIIGMAMGATIQPLSIATFLLVMAIPAYAFVLGLTFFFAILLRHRLLSGIVVAAIVITIVTLNMAFVPIWLLPAVDITGAFSIPVASDIVPSIVDLRGGMQRLGFLLFGFALLCFTAAIHPRRDDTPKRRMLALGLGLFLVGGSLPGWVVWDAWATMQRGRTFKAYQQSRATDPAPDVLTVTGEVRIEPGSRLSLDLALRFRAPETAALETALFSLNPGLAVQAASDPSGRALEHEQHSGLLELTLPARLGPGEETTIDLRIEGQPDPFFGYLDSALDPLAMGVRDGAIFMLGYLSVINTGQYTALMPGSSWLPLSGPEVGRGDPAGRPRDFFEVDLEVEVPEGWLVAGPGKRQEIEGADGTARFRFAPPAHLPGVALLASRFESRSTEIDGVTLEVLVHPKHDANFEVLEDAAGEIRDWLAEKLRDAEDVGLPYPYDALTLVETPASLRGFGGGWRGASALTQPGLILTRESGFPTARFDHPFKDPDKWKDSEGGVPGAMRRRLESFFENDFSGGNPFIAAAHNFFSFQTGGEGPAGLPLDFVYEDLATRLVTDKRGYFSVHHHGRELNTMPQEVMQSMFRRGTTAAEAMIYTVTSRPQVWDAVLGASLIDLDVWEAPEKALDVLTLKGGAMAQSMLDGLGREKTGRLLSGLREQSDDGTFSRDDVVALGQVIDEDLDAWLRVWLEQTDLPGFTVGDVQLRRVQDTDDGTPQYQTLLTLRNEESTPGLVKLEYRSGERAEGPRRGQRRKWDHSDPMNVAGRSAVEIGLITSKPIHALRVAPYLALNRDPFNVTLPDLDEETLVDAEPFIGSREVPLVLEEGSMIVVDDLDEGFSIVAEESGSFRIQGRGTENQNTDQGLPISQGRPTNRWSRRQSASAFGKYRHTMAVVRPGKGERVAIFTAELPTAGQWELQYYLPSTRGRRRRGGGKIERGIWNLTIEDSSGSQQVPFDADGAEEGWNSLGKFEMARGDAQVKVSDKAEGNGRSVVADAIRWVPASGATETTTQ